MALGLFVSAFAQTEFQAVQFMPAVIYPQLLLCGLFIERHEMAAVLYSVSGALPLTYAYDALARATSPRPLGGEMAVDVCVILGSTLVALGLGALTLRRPDLVTARALSEGFVNGTAVTGTGEVFSSSLVTVPRALCRRECCSQPTTIARAPWRRAASVSAVTGSSSETSVTMSTSNSESSPSSRSSSITARPRRSRSCVLEGRRRGVQGTTGVHDHELPVGMELAHGPPRRPARAVGSVITEHEARPAGILSGVHVDALSRSSVSRYGARYFAAIFVGGDQVGVSVISELNPCPPAMWAVR